MHRIYERALIGDAIRAAIGRGYRVYDFGHGDEPYKYRLGARDLITRSLRIRRQPGLAQP